MRTFKGLGVTYKDSIKCLLSSHFLLNCFVTIASEKEDVDSVYDSFLSVFLKLS